MRTLFCMLLGAASVAVGACWYGAPGIPFAGTALGQPPAVSPGLADLTALSDRFEAVAQAVLPAVVSIDATKPSTSSTSSKSTTVEDSGSGIIVAASDRPGYVVITNHHVVSGSRPEQISINLADGRLLRPTHVYADAETDIAVLRVEGTSLPSVHWGDSERMRIGQWVLALGSPFGLSQSVTHGIISARERGQIKLGDHIRVKDFLQTDAAINPGSSGGPLVNLQGEVIGINTAIASQSGSNSGVAFAIPANIVKRVAKQLQERGSVAYGYLGLRLDAGFQPVNAVTLGLDRARGARIDAVVPESPAALAGLRVNDVILQLDSVSIRNDNHLINLISMLPAGQRVHLQVWRERKVMAVDAVVGDWSVAKSKIWPTSAQ
ncbi:MAG: S1C family serine protease [Gemmataceae bacterium]